MNERTDERTNVLLIIVQINGLRLVSAYPAPHYCCQFFGCGEFKNGGRTDELTNEGTNDRASERANERTNERTNERKK